MYDAGKNKNNYYSRKQIHSKLNLSTQVEEFNTSDNSILEFVLENSSNSLPSTKTIQRKALKGTTYLKIL
jgi:hypothetical protein